MNSRYKKLITTFLVIGIPSLSYAQEVVVMPVFELSHTLFLAIVIGAGISIAMTMAFTNSSIAGVGAVISGKFANFLHKKPKANSDGNSDNLADPSWYQKSKDLKKKMLGAAHSYGALAMIGSALSLFLGSLVASLAMPASSFQSVIFIGLGVWAFYTMLITYFKSKIISTALVPTNFVTSRGSAVAKSVGTGLLGKSDKSRVRSVVRSAVKDIKREFTGEYANSKLSKQLDELINSSNDSKDDGQQTLVDLAELINRTEIRLVPIEGAEGKKFVVSTDFNAVSFGSSNSKKLGSAVSSLKAEAQSNQSPENKAAAMLSVVTPASKEQIKRIFDKVRQTIEDSGNEDIQLDKLSDDLDQLKDDPTALRHLITEKFSSVEQDHLVNAVSSLTGSDKNKIRENMDKVANFFEEKFNTSEKSSGKPLMIEDFIQARGRTPNFKERLSTLRGTALDPSKLGDDLEKISNDPSQLFKVVSERVSSLTKDDVKSLVGTNTNLSVSEIESYIRQYDRYHSSLTHKKSKAKRIIMEANLASKTFVEGCLEAHEAMLWWRAASPIVGAAASVGGAAMMLLQ